MTDLIEIKNSLAAVNNSGKMSAAFVAALIQGDELLSREYGFIAERENERWSLVRVIVGKHGYPRLTTASGHLIMGHERIRSIRAATIFSDGIGAIPRAQ